MAALYGSGHFSLPSFSDGPSYCHNALLCGLLSVKEHHRISAHCLLLDGTHQVSLYHASSNVIKNERFGSTNLLSSI